MESPVIFGEALFDQFPDGEAVLGGAPFNVAWHLQGFGLQPRFVSCVGRDALGDRVLQSMRDWGMATDAVQVHADKPTGRVNITIQNHEPSYEICQDQAYDNLCYEHIPESIQHMRDALFYHGSLAVRSGDNAQVLNQLLDGMANRHCTILMDVNLRPPWWRADALHAFMQSAHWLKLNLDELRELSGLPVNPENLAASCRQFMAQQQLQGLIVTMGEHGARLLAEQFDEFAPTPAVENFVNTVGAGDAFTAVMIVGLYQHWRFADCLQRAQQFAARVCANKAAVISDAGVYRGFAEQWGL